MELTRWTPFGELDAFERRMRRIFADAGLAPVPLPAADVYETDAEFVVELEVPGYAEENLTVETSDHVLHVKGERKEAKERAEKTFQVHERLAASFDRRFTLPANVDVHALAASFEQGVLKVRAPKLEAAQSHRVEIKTA
jgi:HSP20 family protein